MSPDNTPRPRTQPSPKSPSAFDLKPLPPTPAPLVGTHWSHAVSPRMRDDVSSLYSQDSPTLGTSQTTLCPIPAPATRRATSMAPPPRPPRDSIDPTLAAFFPNRDPLAQQPPAACHFDTILDRQQTSAGPSVPAQEPEKPKRVFFSRESLSFARKALQTGRKKPPVKVDTTSFAQISQPRRTPYPEPVAPAAPRPSSSRSHRRSASSTCSQAVARMFRRSAAREAWINAVEKPSDLPRAPPPTPDNRTNRGSGGSGWYEDDSDEGNSGNNVINQQRIIPSWSRRAGGPDTPRPVVSHQWPNFMRNVVMSRDERRRRALRDKIRVIPEGQPFE